MIFVLSSQRFSPPIFVSVGNVFSVITTFERNKPSSERFTIHLLKRSISAFIMIFVHTLIRSHNSLVFSCRLFSIHYYVRTIIVSLPMQRFSLRNVVRMILVLSSHLAFSMFLHTPLSRLHDTGLPKVFSVLVHLYVSIFTRYYF